MIPVSINWSHSFSVRTAGMKTMGTGIIYFAGLGVLPSAVLWVEES